MSTTTWAPTGAHLVGSVPLAGVEEVMRAAATVLPEHLKRVTDGETGPLRKNWIGCQYPVLAATAGLEEVASSDGYGPPVAFRLRPAVDPDTVELPRLGYGDWAQQSFQEFHWLTEQEVIPAHWRFQVSLPTPPALMLVLVDADARATLEPLWSAALLRELEAILAAVPHERLAIQFDVCQEVGLWEGFYPSYWGTGVDVRERAIAGVAQLVDAVPGAVEVGVHLCYGDYEHKHFMEPRDAGTVRDMANALTAATQRRLDYLHLPIPRERDDEAFVRPLAQLALDPGTQLYLGLIHHTDGEQGTRLRIEVAHRVVDEFGIATECGLGRRSPIVIGELLELHRQLADPHDVAIAKESAR